LYKSIKNSKGVEMKFIKMHGLGNDFVICDLREQKYMLDCKEIRKISDRRLGVGCDQLIVLKESENPAADVYMKIYNADGSEVGACGNATRCVGQMIIHETGKTHVVIETIEGLLTALETNKNNWIRVDMGEPRLLWHKIPLAEEQDTAFLDLDVEGFSNPVAVNVGNPHAVFFVEDIASVNLMKIGPLVENHVMFPEKTNVEFVQVINKNTLKMRVWERGVGITEACGTGACATLVAAVRRSMVNRSAVVQLDGGDLEITWDEKTGHVWMSGPVCKSFEGHLAADLLG